MANCLRPGDLILLVLDDGMIIEVDDDAIHLIGTRRPSVLHEGGKRNESIGDALHFSTVFKKGIAIVGIDKIDRRVGILKWVVGVHVMFDDCLRTDHQVRFDIHHGGSIQSLQHRTHDGPSITRGFTSGINPVYELAVTVPFSCHALAKKPRAGIAQERLLEFVKLEGIQRIVNHFNHFESRLTLRAEEVKILRAVCGTCLRTLTRRP